MVIKMKNGTLVLMADLEGENFCRKVMLSGAMDGGLGVAAAGVPRHISLGMPYEVKDYEAYLAFAEEYAAQLHPVEITLNGIKANPLGSMTGNYCFTFDTNINLEKLRAKTRNQLRSRLDLEVPEADGVTGSRNITLGFGKASFDAYQAFVASVDPATFQGVKMNFDELGVFYYDEATIAADNFCVVKRIKLH